MDKKHNIPTSAMNPIYRIFTLDWFLYLLGEVINKNDYNLYVIQDLKHQAIRKDFGNLAYKFAKKKLVEQIMKIDGVTFIGDYETQKLLVLSKRDITKELVWINSEKDFDIAIGATASLDSDNEWTLVGRGLKALDLARVAGKEIKYQLI